MAKVVLCANNPHANCQGSVKVCAAGGEVCPPMSEHREEAEPGRLFREGPSQKGAMPARGAGFLWRKQTPTGAALSLCSPPGEPPRRGVASPRLAQSMPPVCHRAYGRIHRPCKIRPSAERTTTCKGMAFSLPATACWTARWMPPQQGTSIRTTVTLRMSLASRSWVSLSR